MKILINAPFPVKEHLRDLIHEKVQKLTTFYHRIDRIDVYLRREIKDHESGNSLELRVHAPHKEFFAAEKSSDFESALSEAVEKIRVQLLKHKSKLRRF